MTRLDHQRDQLISFLKQGSIYPGSESNKRLDAISEDKQQERARFWLHERIADSPIAPRNVCQRAYRLAASCHLRHDAVNIAMSSKDV